METILLGHKSGKIPNVCTVKIRTRLQNDPFRTISSLFFCKLHVYLSKKLASEGHFEVSNMSKS